MNRNLEEALGRLGDLGRRFVAHCEGISGLQCELNETLGEVRKCIAAGQQLSPDELRIALKDFWAGLEALGPVLVTLFLQEKMIEMKKISCAMQPKQCRSDATFDLLN